MVTQLPIDSGRAFDITGPQYEYDLSVMSSVLSSVPICSTVAECMVSESDARPEGRAFESRPIRDARLCSWTKHFTTNCRVFSDRTPKSVGPRVFARGSKIPHSGYINVTCSGLTHSSI